MSAPPPPRRSPQFDATVPVDRPHLLDATASWGVAGGMRRVIGARHAGLAALGWRHTLLAPGARGSSQLDAGGLPLPGSGGERLPLRRGRLAGLITAARPDLIEVADAGVLAWAAQDASARLGVPTIAVCHTNLPALAARLVGGAQGMGTGRGLWAARRAQAYLADLYAGFDLVLAPSRSMVRRLQAWGLRQVQHQPLGVDCALFNPAQSDPAVRHRIAQHLGVDAGTRLLVYSGRFTADKHLDLLAEAVQQLGPGHLLVAVGSGPRPPHGERVRCLPPMAGPQQLARLLANADLCVHAGGQETSGLGVLEAMASGVPVVLNAADALGELAAAGGLAVAGHRARDWAEAMAFALSADLAALRVQALAHARLHDWRRVLAQMVQRYQWLLQQDAQHRQATRAVLPSQPAVLSPMAPADLPPAGLAGHR